MVAQNQEKLLGETRRLLERLERLSADSHWAHRASGIRGSLLRCLEIEDHQLEFKCWQAIVNEGYILLTKAAREIPDFETR